MEFRVIFAIDNQTCTVMLIEKKTIRLTVAGADNCVDNNDQCHGWASIGECEKNPNYMLNNCKLSCNVCTPSQSGELSFPNPCHENKYFVK